MPLRTLDEATHDLASSLLAIAATAPVSVDRLGPLLDGRGALRGLPKPGRDAVLLHRCLLAELHQAGLGWLLPDQVEGVLSYVAAERGPLLSSSLSNTCSLRLRHGGAAVG